MQRRAFLINTWRGNTIDGHHCVRSLSVGDSGAGPDVVSEVNPVASLPQIIVAPQSAVWVASLSRAFAQAAAKTGTLCEAKPCSIWLPDTIARAAILARFGIDLRQGCG